MTDLLQLVFEYRRLVAHRTFAQGRLSVNNRKRLAGLERLFGQEPGDQALMLRRRHARCDVRLPATVQMGKRVQAVDVVNLGGGGLRVEPAPLLRRGERAIVRVISIDEGVAYSYPVAAGWVQRDSHGSSMGMPFVGTPSRSPLSRRRLAEGSAPRIHPARHSTSN